MSRWLQIVQAGLTFALILGNLQTSSAQVLRTFHTFTRMAGDFPEGGLLQASDGDLYGTTSFGAIEANGTIFKVTANGVFVTLHRLQREEGTHPYAALIEGSDGQLYGTASDGGTAFVSVCPTGCGTVFRVSPSGSLTRLYSFCSLANCADGTTPVASLLQASDGHLYGTTLRGGAYGNGTIFRITPNGVLTTIHSFCAPGDCSDGLFSRGPLIQGQDGDLYGTTEGTFFKVTLAGIFTTLHSFSFDDGTILYAGVVQANDGNFYGTASYGGTYNAGTLFQITPAGTVRVLHNFCSLDGCADGATPVTAPVQGSDGALYGTTNLGGIPYSGTFFKSTLGGVLTTLYSFCSEQHCSDGAVPLSLIQDTNGRSFGPTYRGGYGYGTLYDLDTGLELFVVAHPDSGSIGTAVKIFGTNLSRSSAVTFNGVPATFEVVSPTVIKARVPAGAQTGYVQVATPDGTLTSSGIFAVR